MSGGRHSAVGTSPPPAQPALKRSISLPLLVVYGVGTMVGGGFYALLGRIAGEAGMRAPLSLLVAAVVALFSALSFGALSSRYPSSAGEARYVFEAFHRSWLAEVVGWAVIATGVVSAATLAAAFVGFLQDIVSVPTRPAIAVLVLVLGGVAIWGITQSVALVAIITAVEVGGLLYVFFVAAGSLADLPHRLPQMALSLAPGAWSGVLLGGFLAFYAFIGFEDMVNLAEEVKRPRTTLPRAIVLSLGITTGLYLAVATVAVLAVPPLELAASRTPLARVLGIEATRSALGITLVSMLAGVNGALVQIVMAARVAYGMASKARAPAFLAVVNPYTRTPAYATLLVIVVTLGLALWFPLVTLARMTSAIILVVFTAVNLALVVVQRRPGPLSPEVRRVSAWIPVVGAVLCLGLLAFQGWATVTSLLTP